MTRRARFLCFVVFFAGFLSLASWTSYAEEQAEREITRYRISQDGGEYCLYSLSGAEESVIGRSSALSDLFSRTLMAGDADVTFSNVHTDAPLFLCGGTYRFRGALSVCGASLTVADGARLELAEGVIRMKEGSLRVAEGTVVLAGGSIVGVGEPAVTLDHAASAVFCLIAGSVHADTAPAIQNRVGSVLITGGTISSGADAAIRNDATLMLGGTPGLIGEGEAIETSRPVTLCAEGRRFVGELTVRFLGTCEEGGGMVCFYDAEGADPTLIRLVDGTGARRELRYYADASFTPETAFLAVTSPYVVRAGERTFERFSGETLALPPIPDRPGYEPIGYAFENGESCPQDLTCTGDLTLREIYRLCPPTATLSSGGFTYDGMSHALRISGLSHPLVTEGTLTYTWFHDGELLPDTGDGILVREVRDSGVYTCRITLTVNGESTSTLVTSAPVLILPKTVETPILPRTIYNLSEIQAVIGETEDYHVLGLTLADSAGFCSVRLGLTDPENTSWRETEADVLILSVPVVKTPDAPADAPAEDGPNPWRPPFDLTHLAIGLFFVFLILLALLLLRLRGGRRRDILSPDGARAIVLPAARRLSLASPACAPIAVDASDPAFSALSAVDADYADTVLSDRMARSFIEPGEECVITFGRRSAVVNLDCISREFLPGERVDINLLKERALIPYDTGHVKILARGVLDKPLYVVADEFSLPAVKMIVLAGGKAVRVRAGRADRPHRAHTPK